MDRLVSKIYYWNLHLCFYDIYVHLWMILLDKSKQNEKQGLPFKFIRVFVLWKDKIITIFAV